MSSGIKKKDLIRRRSNLSAKLKRHLQKYNPDNHAIYVDVQGKARALRIQIALLDELIKVAV